MTTAPINILVITSDPALIQTCVKTVSTLQNGYTVSWVAYTWDMLPLILNSPAPIVVADLRTPHGDDLDLLSSMSAAFPNASLLAFVADSTRADALFKMNVLDYLTPADLTPASLERVLRLAHHEYVTRAELQLVKSELMLSQSRLQSIFENLPIGISLVGLDGTTIMHNPAVYRILGALPGELDGLHFAAYLHPDDFPAAARNFENILRSGGASIELRFIRKDGSLIWCNVRASVVCDPDNQPMYMIATMQDVTAQKLADRLLQNSELKFRTLTETTAAAIVIHNGTQVVYVNKAALELSGYTDEDIRSVNVWNLVHPDHRDSARELWERRLHAQPSPPHY